MFTYSPSAYTLWMMKAIYPSCLECTFSNHIQFLIVYFLLFPLLIMFSLKSDCLLFIASTTVAIFPGHTLQRRLFLFPPSAIFLCLTVTPQHPSFWHRHQVKGRNQDVLDQLVLKIFYITLDPHVFTCWFKNLCSFLWTVFLLMWWLYRNPWENRMKWNISQIIPCNSLKSEWNWPFKIPLILSAKCVFIPWFRRLMHLQDSRKWELCSIVQNRM